MKTTASTLAAAGEVGLTRPRLCPRAAVATTPLPSTYPVDRPAQTPATRVIRADLSLRLRVVEAVALPQVLVPEDTTITTTTISTINIIGDTMGLRPTEALKT